MGYRTVFTDHSLFELVDASAILLSIPNKFIYCNLDHAICVSHTGKENLFYRTNLDSENISVIPNAVDTNRFTPDPSKRFPLNTINIVISSLKINSI